MHYTFSLGIDMNANYTDAENALSPGSFPVF